MKEYKVEVRTYYSKVTMNANHIAESSQEETQKIIDGYAADGWRLASADSTSYGLAVYVYLYFERDVA
ncbi:DUF4177 domain-containing protein [Alienimonas chondri]|uniref:DUF4177 domain-containing protein n=1 Tax=Alienimonas chondri TaxID=2681879 RepID=A0ABX1VEH1_9PLAN|nr:DUF4177 domain-containing protein [Alienimonas chondri]NNJ26472.1 hypothetical protein [Alienimonas chondri]